MHGPACAQRGSVRRNKNMGIFDFLSKNKSDQPPRASQKEIARLERLLGNKLSQNFDRQEAIQELGRMGTAQAAAALLKRFDWVLEQRGGGRRGGVVGGRGVRVTLTYEPIH